MSGRAARKAQNRSLHVPGGTKSPTYAPKSKRWKRATESERKGLAEELLAAMAHEDDVRRPIESQYESWEERRQRKDSIACIPFTITRELREKMPYQCMKKGGNFLVAARGSNIDLFNSADGSFYSTWSSIPPQVQPLQNGNPAPLMAADTERNASSHPAKRRKLSEGEDEEKSGSKDDTKEPGKGEKEKKQKRSEILGASSGRPEAPAVVGLAVTKTAQHVIVITAEDKSIRVFEVVDQNGVPQLKHLTQRAMPKRPSALAITDDSSTIISADKFGDVYSLPLLPSELAPQNEAARASSVISERPYKPAANELTIHSQRNRRALENQKQLAHTTAEKTAPTFEHNLLIGHVSMLTDLSLVTLNGRDYIITADRDEHIRVSRGIPQSHIIENFCLGHKEFISRICIPKERPELLISGGGDDYLGVWNWETGKLISQADLKGHATKALREPRKVAVSGIFHSRQSSDGGFRDIICVACEGIAAVFIFSLAANNMLEYVQSLELQGNALYVATDLPTLELGGRMVVSIDDVHKPGSTTELRADDDTAVNPLQAFIFANDAWVPDTSFKMAVVKGDDAFVGKDGNDSRLQNLLYSIENLRKRDGEERGGEATGDDTTESASHETGTIQEDDVQVTT